MALGQMIFLANKCSCLRRTGHMEIKFIKKLFLNRSPQVSIPRLLSALCTIFGQHSSSQNVIIGDFSINWTQESTRQSLYNLMIKEKNFRQLISGFTTDNRTIIDHLYTDLIEEKIYAGTLESYFSDHKAIWASLPVRSSNKRNHCVTFILPALINSKQNQFSHMRTITVVTLNSLQH